MCRGRQTYELSTWNDYVRRLFVHETQVEKVEKYPYGKYHYVAGETVSLTKWQSHIKEGDSSPQGPVGESQSSGK